MHIAKTKLTLVKSNATFHSISLPFEFSAVRHGCAEPSRAAPPPILTMMTYYRLEYKYNYFPPKLLNIATLPMKV